MWSVNQSAAVSIVSTFYHDKSKRENLRFACWLISLLVFSFIIARYILLKLKTLNSRHFKCVSHQLSFYVTVITTDNVKYFGYVIVVTCIKVTISSD